MKSKIVFLDIDGVLNDHYWCEEAKSCLIKKGCVDQLNRIILSTDCSFVLSSSWRYMLLNRSPIFSSSMDIKGFYYLLRTHGVSWKFDLLGITCSDEELPTRGQQINKWINDNQKIISHNVKILAIDDLDLNITSLGIPLIKTLGSVGLTKQDADAAIEFLNREQPKINKQVA